MAMDAITAIKDSRPPITDPVTYLTIIESHLSPDILPTLNEILEDAELTQAIGWDLIQLLLPIPGSEACLLTIARLGNPRECVLKATEALSLLDLESDAGAEDEAEEDTISSQVQSLQVSDSSGVPTAIDQFCMLLRFLAVVHPRIKTKYPSRFLSSTLMAILSTYSPSHQATHAISDFAQALSSTSRPMLPQRKSSASSSTLSMHDLSRGVAPDPEATEEDPNETSIQKKLLQAFVTHVLEEYVKANVLEWSSRLQEHFQPSKVVQHRKSMTDTYKEDAELQERDICVGQLVARARDLGLTGHTFLFDSLEAISPPSEDEDEEALSPTSPDDIPLSKAGCLFLVTSFIFGNVMFDNKVTLPPLTIFPDHSELVKHFLGIDGPTTIGSEMEGVIDAILAIGLWLEESSRFVAGPLEDEEFLQELQTLSLLSANTPSPTLRYSAHMLTCSILHAHPTDRARLTFINDTLEECPYENLKGAAVGWLKEEFIMAHERQADNIFSSPVALGSVQPYLFPDMTAIEEATAAEIWEDLQVSFPFHMAVVNLLIFLGNSNYEHVMPEGTLSIVEEIYLDPMHHAQARLQKELSIDGGLRASLGNSEADIALRDVELLGERLIACLE